MSSSFSAEMIFFSVRSDRTKVLQWLLNAKQTFRLEADEQPNKRALAHAADKIISPPGELVGFSEELYNDSTIKRGIEI